MRDTLTLLNSDVIVTSGPTKSDALRNRSKSVFQSNVLPNSSGFGFTSNGELNQSLVSSDPR